MLCLMKNYRERGIFLRDLRLREVYTDTDKIL